MCRPQSATIHRSVTTCARVRIRTRDLVIPGRGRNHLTKRPTSHMSNTRLVGVICHPEVCSLEAEEGYGAFGWREPKS